jgi:hypothetical protein
MNTHATAPMAEMTLDDVLAHGTEFDIHAFPRPANDNEHAPYAAALAADEKLRQFLESEDGNHAKLHQLESEALATLLRYSRVLAARMPAAPAA